MISRATIFWLVALAGMVLMTVTVSLEVNRVNRQIQAIDERRQSVEERTTLLKASYQLLISPDRLTRLADRHLELEEVRGDQLIALEQLPAHPPVPSARRQAPEQYGQRDAEPPAVQPPRDLPTPRGQPMPRGLPQTPPWLEALGDPALQPVNLSTPQGRPQ